MIVAPAAGAPAAGAAASRSTTTVFTGDTEKLSPAPKAAPMATASTLSSIAGRRNRELSLKRRPLYSDRSSASSALGTPTDGIGSIVLDGQPLEGIERSALAQAISVVPSQVDLPFSMRVEEVVQLGRIPHENPFTGATEGVWLELSAEPTDFEDLEPIDDDLMPEGGFGIIDVKYADDTRVALDGSLMSEW